MFDPDAPVPWDHPVEMFEAGSGLRVKVREMTLRQAVECFREIPEDARWGYGIDVHDMYLMAMSGRPVGIGFLNASGLAELVGLLPD